MVSTINALKAITLPRLHSTVCFVCGWGATLVKTACVLQLVNWTSKDKAMKVTDWH